MSRTSPPLPAILGGKPERRLGPEPSFAQLRRVFDTVAPGTVGIEEEVMLLDPQTLELAPRAPEVLARLSGDPRFKLELPASQLEITLGPFDELRSLERALYEARRDLAGRAGDLVRVAAAGVHPFSSGVGPLNDDPRYAHTLTEYAPVAPRQLVCALQVHVAVGGADRTLAVYNALRSYLPFLAALAANAPYYEGRDCALASVRPKLTELLPRQGVPPPLESWQQYAEALRWGARSGAFPEPRTWWWELRPHPVFGTLELRVPDAQTTVSEAVAVAAVAHALVLWLAERHDAGERLSRAPTWRIEENRWSACRHGPAGTMFDLESGEPRASSQRLAELLDVLAPSLVARASEQVLGRARALARHSGAWALRRVVGEAGVHDAVGWLSERFLAGPGG